jgi:mannosyltransferase OCH1-like enzyme
MNAKKFSDLMLHSGGYKGRTKIENWNILEDLYNHIQLYTQKEQRIPKIIHQIWLGSEVPTSLRQHMDSIQRVNLDYKYILWTDLEADKFDFKNKDLYNNCKNYGQKSDILRYAILNEFGGVYLDTDFVGCKSFDELLNLDFFTGVSYDKEPTMFNGLIGSTPGNAIITALNDIKEVRDGDGMEVIKSTGPWYLTDVVYNNIMNVERIAVMPLEYFYPYPNFNHDKVLGDDYTKYITEKTICVHLWHSRWN